MDDGIIKTPIPKCRLYWCFCLGWCINFVDSESGRNRVLLLQNMVYSTTQQPPPPPHSHTLSVYTVHFHGKGGGVGEVTEKVGGRQFTRGVENTNTTDGISSLSTGHLGLCVFIVPSSMHLRFRLSSFSQDIKHLQVRVFTVKQDRSRRGHHYEETWPNSSPS